MYCKPRFQFLPILALALVIALGCSSGKKNNNNANNVAPPSAGAAKSTPTPTPEALLQTAIQNTEALKSFHFTLTHENGSTPIAQGISMTKADGDFVRPDRFKATVTGKLQGFSVEVPVVNVGDMVWLAIVGNRFVPLPNGVPASAILDPDNGVLKAAKGVKSPAYAGTDRINGVDTTVISGKIDAGDLTALDSEAQAGKLVNGRVWVGVADQRLYRLRVEGPLNDSEPANIVRQIDLSQFNESVDIQPPQ